MPWARRMTVETKRWLNEDEFVDALAMCQIIPGPNIVNFSVALGARFQGLPGAVAAVTGLLAAPMFIVVCMSIVLEQVADNPRVIDALHGMAAVAAALVIAMSVKVTLPLVRRRDWLGMALACAAFVAVALLQLPMVPSLLVLAPIAIGLERWRR